MSTVPSGYTNATPPPFKSTYADVAYCRYDPSPLPIATKELLRLQCEGCATQKAES